MGDKELDRLMAELPRRYVNPAKRAALREAGTPIWKDARANLRALGGIKTKNLLKSMGQVIRTYRGSGNVIAVVGARRPLGSHGHLYEFGTGPRYDNGKFRGAMPPSPFLEPAFRSNVGRAMATIGRRLREEIAKGMRKAAEKMR